MNITWHGGLCFSINGKETKIAIDPYADSDHKLKSLKADVILCTDNYDEKKKLVDGAEDAEVISWPGEYEIKGAAIIAIPAYTNEHEEGNTAKGRIILHSFTVDDVCICHLGMFGEELDEDTIEKIGNVDILLVPIAGENTMDAKKAHIMIEKIEPRVVIPMNYKNDEELAPMLKEMGVVDPEKLEEFEVKSKSQLPEDKTDFVVLEAV